jgi:hypothetical protein
MDVLKEATVCGWQGDMESTQQRSFEWVGIELETLCILN